MKKIEKIMIILRDYKDKLKKEFSVKNLAVFGSYIRGERRRGSDIDVLVEFKEPIGLFKFMDLEEYLEKLIGVKVDLVSKKALKPRIGKQILSEAVYI